MLEILIPLKLWKKYFDEHLFLAYAYSLSAVSGKFWLCKEGNPVISRFKLSIEQECYQAKWSVQTAETEMNVFSKLLTPVF